VSLPLYQGIHRSQYDGTPRANENCTPTSGANGARCATGGKTDKSGGAIRGLLRRDEETSPETAGWSLPDLDLAMSRLGVSFHIGQGGWDGVRAARQQRKMIVLQGDSEEFPNGTCSGVFNGDHAVAIHPDTNGSLWLLADPICNTRRWESEYVLRRYASNFRPSIAFGVFPTPVPELQPPSVPVPTGWVRVTGSFWQYAVRGNPTTGYAKTTREQKTTKGFSANVGKVIETSWGGRDRMFAKVISGAYSDTWLDLLDDGQVRHFAAA
jgi:hypothetical protein